MGFISCGSNCFQAKLCSRQPRLPNVEDAQPLYTTVPVRSRKDNLNSAQQAETIFRPASQPFSRLFFEAIMRRAPPGPPYTVSTAAVMAAVFKHLSKNLEVSIFSSTLWIAAFSLAFNRDHVFKPLSYLKIN
jgi:hypothetical protein